VGKCVSESFDLAVFPGFISRMQCEADLLATPTNVPLPQIEQVDLNSY
jgi:hypothetical protein